MEHLIKELKKMAAEKAAQAEYWRGKNMSRVEALCQHDVFLIKKIIAIAEKEDGREETETSRH